MRLMKRALFFVLVVALGAVFMAPFGIVLDGGRVTAQPNAVLAASSAPAPPGPAQPCSVQATAGAYAGRCCPNNTVPDATGACPANVIGGVGCVKIALPFTNGGSRCVDNSSGTGGAVINYLRQVLAVMSGAIGLVIVLMLVIGGVQYITSIADPARVKAAKNRIQNAIIALVLYLCMFAILSFLVPGGIL